MKDKKETKKVEDKVRIKFVHRANLWCKTIFKDGKQIQEWYLDEELTKRVQLVFGGSRKTLATEELFATGHNQQSAV